MTTATFVEDYLQLDFSPYGFLVFHWPNIFANGRTLQFSDQGISRLSPRIYWQATFGI